MISAGFGEQANCGGDWRDQHLDERFSSSCNIYIAREASRINGQIEMANRQASARLVASDMQVNNAAKAVLYQGKFVTNRSNIA